MLSTPRWLSLEAKFLDRSQSFYDLFLGLAVVHERDGEVVFEVGDAELRLREPGDVPRGGLHTHYALSIPSVEYDAWYAALDEHFDLVEHQFDDSRSLYLYDIDGNCVELGASNVESPADERRTDGHEIDVDELSVDGLFEVAIEVEQLESAREFYERLGFDVVDDGDERRRVRMTTGDLDLEVWEPQRGIADARGGVHADLGIVADDPETISDRVTDVARSVEETVDGVRIRDPDGHYVTLCPDSVGCD